MAFFITDQVIGNQEIDDNSATQRPPLGTIVRAVDPTYGAGEFISLIGVASTLVGTVVTYLSLNSKNDDYISATNAVKACSDDDGCTVEMQMGLFNTADKKKDDALGAQDINNILLLSSIGVAVGTAAIAIFFTNWDDDSANEDSTARLTFDVKPVQDGAIATLRGRFE